MVWALLLLLGVVVAVHWFEYRRSVQEYTFAQPKILGEISDVIGEKTPIVVEVGVLPWRPEIATGARWNVSVEDGPDIPVSEWLTASPRPLPQNGSQLATEMGLEHGLIDVDDGRRWWWMSGLHDTNVGILDPGAALGLSWVDAERQWLGCTAGAPLVVWLVHSRYRRYLPDSKEPIDPWNLTVADTPWIGRVQYIEVRVRPGWCIGIPAHWGFAVRADDGDSGGAWWWMTSQHSPLSWGLRQLSDTNANGVKG